MMLIGRFKSIIGSEFHRQLANSVKIEMTYFVDDELCQAQLDTTGSGRGITDKE